MQKNIEMKISFFSNNKLKFNLEPRSQEFVCI